LQLTAIRDYVFNNKRYLVQLYFNY